MNGLYDEFRVALHSVWTRRWLVLAVAWAICIAGWLAVASIPNRYDSRARLLVDVNQILPDDAGGGGGGQQLDQIRETLTSARNLEKVAATTGLIGPDAGEREKAGAVAMLQKNIKVVPQQQNIFEITASVAVGSLSDADNAKLASGVLDSLITVFRDDQLRGGRMDAREGLKFLDAQIADREKALREIEARRAQFEAQNIGLIPGGSGSPAQRVDAARAELSQIDSQLISAQAQLSAANGQLASTPATIAGGGGGVGGGVARQQLAGAQSELASMHARGLTDAHPDVIALKSQIASLKAIADREGSGGGGGGGVQNPAYASLAAMRAERQATVSALGARKSQLLGDIAKITSQQIQNPGIAAEYDRINGEYTALKAQYDKLLGQREQVRLRGEVQTETDAIKVELLDPPSKPTSPAAPNRPLFLTLVLVAGLGGGVAAAFGLSQVRTSYATAGKLERASGLPVIGSITEVVTPERHVERRKRLVWLAGGGAALVGLYALLLIAEFVQRGMVA
ncbi:chain-length determining protein [Sphingopyxis sp. BSN-002]|uniref:XrtA system polysaccharide chain length determinant n=1 Tax=Sphingopyxis sp. BSN-002 TaxID=2911495 RepID=UPI001EDBC62F|nr:XrtA system polysaccharide chain length determinant [Sphingopyxis sp. BSN-002]UKK85684.1 chain-length determining protein [Sphingopyxis sp. BSN-002]